MLRASDTRNRTSEFFSPLLELIHLKEKKKKCFLISAMRTNSVFLSSGGGDYLLVKVPNALTSGPYISAGYFSFAVSQQTLLKTFNCIETFSIFLKKNGWKCILYSLNLLNHWVLCLWVSVPPDADLPGSRECPWGCPDTGGCPRLSSWTSSPGLVYGSWLGKALRADTEKGFQPPARSENTTLKQKASKISLVLYSRWKLLEQMGTVEFKWTSRGNPLSFLHPWPMRDLWMSIVEV